VPNWQVLIIDDLEASSAHLRSVAGQPGFAVVAIASGSEEAHAVLRGGTQIDLILFDVRPPGTDAVALLKVLREDDGPEVIAMTDAREPKVAQELIHLGVVDHLVKPFEIERLQEALLRFRERMRMLNGPAVLEQGQIDILYPNPRRGLLPKGLQRETLDAVRLALRGAGREFSTAEQVAREALVARVTARRYLEYLVSSRQAETDTSHEGPGRPRKLYRIASPLAVPELVH
jgi:response regulator of citrate/malate metabolism